MRELRKRLTQAEEDLKAAKDSLKDEHYDWVCFQAQQSAEKALKFFLYSRGYTSIITHSLKELVRECKKLEKDFSGIESYARYHSRKLKDSPKPKLAVLTRASV